MIDVVLVVNEEACITSFRASGHAFAAKVGQDPVCAAVSVLLRTFLRALESQKVAFSWKADIEGELEFQLLENGEFVRHCSLFLQQGLLDLEKEAPSSVCVRQRQVGRA